MIFYMKYSWFWECFDVIFVNLKKNYSMKLMFFLFDLINRKVKKFLKLKLII